jgi:xanthine dehydrogenase molybdenum-binding subunit
MAPGAPILLDDLRTNALGKLGDAPTNIAEPHPPPTRRPGAGFAEADVIVEREFHTATVHQGYIEPQNATALWSQDGTVLVWCSTQGAFAVQEQLAELLQMPISRITVTPTEIGGGFGGKTHWSISSRWPRCSRAKPATARSK